MLLFETEVAPVSQRDRNNSLTHAQPDLHTLMMAFARKIYETTRAREMSVCITLTRALNSFEPQPPNLQPTINSGDTTQNAPARTQM